MESGFMDKNCFEIDFIEKATQRFRFWWWKSQANRFEGSRFVEKSQRKKPLKSALGKRKPVQSIYSQCEIHEN